jgi:hypothetical protein
MEGGRMYTSYMLRNYPRNFITFAATYLPETKEKNTLDVVFQVKIRGKIVLALNYLSTTLRTRMGE